MNPQKIGAIESGYDLRDYWYEPTDKGAFDWDRGYDIESVIGTKINAKSQGKSGSCGGQAWSYYMAVLERIATMDYEERSARWIYSHTHVPPNGGSRGRDNCDFVIKRGVVKESEAPSYDNGKPPSEDFMRLIPTLSKEALDNLEVNRALSYLQVKSNIEMVAQAIADNHGCVLVLNGEDNGTWRSSFPQPPTVKEWGHFCFAGKAKIIKGRRHIGVLNSWGDKTGDQGWQWLSEDWFVNPKLGVREGWTLAWNYQPAAHKVVLKKIIKSLQEVVKLYQKLKVK
jgi:hypothetical protein